MPAFIENWIWIAIISGEEDYTECESGPVVDGIIDRAARTVKYRLIYEKQGCPAKSYRLTADMDDSDNLINGEWQDEANSDYGSFELRRTDA